MVYVNWNQSISVDISYLDEQHQGLVALINLIHDAIVENATKQHIDNLLVNFIEKAKIHFKDEEKYMQVFHYPDFKKHKTEHDELTKILTSFMQEYRADISTISLGIPQYMRDWLIGHITGMDKEYAKFIRNSNLTMPPPTASM